MTTWMRGPDEFHPARCAQDVLDSLRPGADPDNRAIVLSMWRYYCDYLHATAARNPNVPGLMPNGTEVNYSWQASVMALFYLQVYTMAVNYWDDDDERTLNRIIWRKTDWEVLWDTVKAEEGGVQ